MAYSQSRVARVDEAATPAAPEAAASPGNTNHYIKVLDIASNFTTHRQGRLGEKRAPEVKT